MTLDMLLDRIFGPSGLFLIAAGTGALLAMYIAAVALVRLRQSGPRRDLQTLFDVPRDVPVRYADMGSGHGLKQKYIRADDLVGCPDALFIGRRRIVVGEYKMARRQKPRRRDRYQTVLYMGIMKARNPKCAVEGRLVYKNIVHRIDFDPDEYRYLLSGRHECRRILSQASG